MGAAGSGRHGQGEVFADVVVADVADHAADQFEVGGDFAALDVRAEEIAEDAAEVFMPGEGEEGARVGEHADEAGRAGRRWRGR